jgi:hypothetical protein
VQACPFFSLQDPVNPLHTCVVSQTPGSSVPDGKLEHLPSLPARLHDLQACVHDDSQQTPSTQLLEPQSVELVHGAPVQGAHFDPPQSTPVSSPFLSPSLHEMHSFFSHEALEPLQSLASTQSTHEPSPSHTRSLLHCKPASTNPETHVPSVHAMVLQVVVLGQSCTLVHVPPDEPSPELEFDDVPLPPEPPCPVVVNVKQPAAAITSATTLMERPKTRERYTLFISSSVSYGQTIQQAHKR